jgi:hypothetical protein
MKQLLFIFALIFFLTGCGDHVVTFNLSQPEDADSLTVMPRKLQGHYIGKDGVTSLDISPNSMIMHSNYEIKLQKDSADWDSLSTLEKSKYRLIGDSVVERITDVDTIFFFSQDNVLKKFKGYYFLNTRLEKDSWYVQKLRLQRGVLIIGSISTEEELKTLEKINESPIDTITYKIKFTRKQFHEYIDNDGFSKVDTFLCVSHGKNKKKR